MQLYKVFSHINVFSNPIILFQLRNLERELEIEKNNVKAQTEKLNSLKKEFTLLNTKSVTQEKENEDLIHKISEITIQLNSNDEILKDKVINFSILIINKSLILLFLMCMIYIYLFD